MSRAPKKKRGADLLDLVLEDAWLCGAGMALAGMHRKLPGGNDSAGVVEVASSFGLTIARAKIAGISNYDCKELRRAGVPLK